MTLGIVWLSTLLPQDTRSTNIQREDLVNNEETSGEQDTDDLKLVETYKENSHTSVCPNMRSRRFIPLSQLGLFFKPGIETEDSQKWF